MPFYLFWPFVKIKHVALEEKMNCSLLTQLFKLCGALTVKRMWIENGKEVRQGLDPPDTRIFFEALKKNWVITFPQGTTMPFAPERKGTANVINHCNLVVISVVIKKFSPGI